MANPLIEKYNSNYDRAKMLINAGREKEALPYLKYALEALYTLAKESNYDPQKRKKYLEAAEKIRPVYDRIKNQSEKIVEDKKPIQNKKTPNDNKDAKANDNANTVFNGIDVSNYFEKQTNEVVTFDDVKGMDDTIAQIKNEFTNDPTIVKMKERLGIKNKNFILFYGVPGTGKTFLAKAMAHDLGTTFLSIPCTKLKGTYHGETENRIIALFDYARTLGRCILFFDEFEAIAKDRNTQGASEVSQSTVTTLITQIDGFNSSRDILVIGATNNPYQLDGAILSRANLKIEVPLPNTDVIYQVMKAKIGKLIDDSVDLQKVSLLLKGFSNRDISNLVENIKANVLIENNMKIQNGEKVDPDSVSISMRDIEKTLLYVKPSTKKEDLRKIEEFKNSF